MEEPSGLSPGASLGKYRLIGLVGRGGMGEVWSAHDPDLDRKVALKVLRPALASADDARARLLREGRAMARLRHANVITVYDATTADGRDVIAMELIDGGSLAGWLAAVRPPGEVVATLIAAGRGLAAAHAAGMIHRDFKPHNVLVDRSGRVVVTDFGLARATVSDPPSASTVAEVAAAPPTTPDLALAETAVTGDAPTSGGAGADRGSLDSPLTRTGSVLGTPAYMAPEQLDGGAVDARGDQFAFCVTAWEALAGTRPFTGSTIGELRAACARGERTGGERLPARLRAILERGLAADPLARWPSMDALLRALDRAWQRPRRAAIAAAVAVLAIAAIAVPIALVRGGRAASGPCGTLSDDAGGLFGKETAARIAALGRLGHGGARAAAYLERWRTAWTDTRARTCARPRDPELLARRVCLTSARDLFASLLDASATATAAEIALADPIAVLPMPDLCFAHARAVAPAPPADPAARAAVAELEAELLAFRVGRRDLARLTALDAVLARARATGYDPVVADALTVRGDFLQGVDPARACAAHAEAAAIAERAGADLVRVNALLGQLECAQADPAHRGDTAQLAAAARGLIDRIGDRSRAAHLELMVADAAGQAGDWDAAIDGAARARAAYLELDAPIMASRAAVIEAEYRRVRARGDDHQRAEAALRAGFDTVPPEATAWLDPLRHRLGDLLWTRGRLDEAVAILMKFPAPPPAGDVALDVTIVGEDGAPVENAEVMTAVEPIGDPLRLVCTELVSTRGARTDARGRAGLAAPRDGLVLARRGDAIAAIEVPAAPGPVTMRLAPVAHITGTVTAVAGAPPADPRAGVRVPRLGAVVMRVGARRWSLVAPVDAHGTFHVFALPGPVAVSVETATPLGDAVGVVTHATVTAGVNRVALALPPPVALRVIVRGPAAGPIAAFAGAHELATWRDVDALRAGDHALALVTASGPLTTADGDARPGDAIAVLGAPGGGPITACVLPATRSPDGVPLAALDRPPDAAAPTCATVAASDAAVGPVILDPAAARPRPR